MLGNACCCAARTGSPRACRGWSQLWFVDYDDVPAARAKLKEIACKMEASYKDGKPCSGDEKYWAAVSREQFWPGVL